MTSTDPTHDPAERFAEAEAGHGDWLAAATAYAATDHGHTHLLTDLLPLAELIGDDARQRALRAALLHGERHRADLDEQARRSQPRSRATSRTELDHVAHDFGVSLAQAERDHAISHAVAALAASPVAQTLVFYGGTALSRTWLPRLRLSEDIDLIALENRTETASQIQTALTRALQRSHGALTWDPPLTQTTGAQPALLRLRGRVAIKIQLMSADDLPAWPTEHRDLIQRYTDAPQATLPVFTPDAFTAAKTTAWMHRAAPRDLYDLWALGHLGLIDDHARQTFRSCGGTGGDPQPWMFRDAPTPQTWTAALAHQGTVRVGPTQALDTVRDLWARACKHEPPGH